MGEQGAFLAACAAADLDDDVFVVVGVAGDEQQLHFGGQAFNLGFCGGELFLCQGF